MTCAHCERIGVEFEQERRDRISSALTSHLSSPSHLPLYPSLHVLFLSSIRRGDGLEWDGLTDSHAAGSSHATPAVTRHLPLVLPLTWTIPRL